VLRVLQPAVSAAGLGVPPEQEVARRTLAAARSGAGAAVVEVLADVPALGLEFIPGPHARRRRRPRSGPGRTDRCGLPPAARRSPVRQRLRDLRQAGRVADLCQRHDLPLPDGYHDHDDEVARPAGGARQRAAENRAVPQRPAAENFIEESPGTVRIIDYQLSGNNERALRAVVTSRGGRSTTRISGSARTAYFGTVQLMTASLAGVRYETSSRQWTWALVVAVTVGFSAV
jgi:hypothetical protein